jgi:drug/metabolite transporter (DMT)-like permease
MLTLILCVILNSLIGVIFKLFEKYKIDNFQAIVVNYYVCVATAAVTFMNNPIPDTLTEKSWFTYAILLGMLFILVFNIMATTVQKSGVMIATIFQKISLVAPALIAIIWFNEKSGLMKWAGIASALIAILLLSYNKKTSESGLTLPTSGLLFPLLTFLGSCMIDSAIFLIEKNGYVQNGDHEFVASLFLFAALTGSIFLAYQMIMGKSKFAIKNVIAGIGLGIPNFFSIYLLFLALQQGLEGSVVFPVNNAGVLLLASLYGIFIFRESVNMYKIAGFIVAVLAIFLITFS